MKFLTLIFAGIAIILTFQSTPALAQSTRWWRIADDCTTEQANFIRAGVDNAATMAVNALRATGLNDVGLVDNSSTPSQESQDLIVWLFGEFTIAVQSIIGTMFGAERGILSMRNREAPANMDLGIDDIKFYCTTKRYVPRIGGGHGSLMYDTDIQAAANVSEKFSCAMNLMWTLNSRNEAENKGYFQIQICPWFLDYASNAPFKWTSGILRQLWAKLTPIRWIGRPLAAKLVYTAVDSVSLFEKVLIHEMTHAYPDRRAQTSDVGGISGYGWTNCRKLSTVDSKYFGPLDNADTFALYASACTIRAHGGTIQEDGAFST